MELSAPPEGFAENHTFNEISVGDTAHIIREITHRDIDLFAVVSGDMNPTHVDDKFAQKTGSKGVVAHSLLGSAMISAVLGNQLPGPGTVFRDHIIQFLGPIYVGDKIDLRITVESKNESQKTIAFDCIGKNQRNEIVLHGKATVLAPTEKIRIPSVDLGNVEMVQHKRLHSLVEMAKKYPPLRTAVVHPCDDVSLQGMDAAAREGLIIPVLVGPEAKIRAAAATHNISIDKYEIISVEHSHAAAIKAVNLAREGKVGALMKGSLHTDELMSAVVHRDNGLRTDSRMSHVFVLDVPTYKWPLLLTDAALLIAPSLIDKKCICQNVIDLAHDIGVEEPKVAILAATESVNPNMAATLDAAALCKMADRGQITGGILDGPLAFDNAISPAALKIKGIRSPVAGRADILVVPTIEAGNMLMKQFVYLSKAGGAGLVLGARVPVMLTSRADSGTTRMASAALAVLSMAGQAVRTAAKSKG